MNKILKNGIITLFALLSLGYSEKGAEFDRAYDDYKRYVKDVNKTASVTISNRNFASLRDRISENTAEKLKVMEKIAEGDTILMGRVKELKKERERMLYYMGSSIKDQTFKYY